MADIQRYLDAISDAVYGEEVRGSIVAGIDAINKEVEKNTDDSAEFRAKVQAEVDEIKNQVNFAEARNDKFFVSNNGQKDLLDSDTAKVRKLVVMGKSEKSLNLWNPNVEVVGWYNTTTHTITYDTNYKSIENVPITNQTKFTVSGHYTKASGVSGRTWMIIVYLDANKNYISSSGGYMPTTATTDAFDGIARRSYEAPSGAKYVTASIGIVDNGSITDIMLAEGDNTYYEEYGIHSIEEINVNEVDQVIVLESGSLSNTNGAKLDSTNRARSKELFSGKKISFSLKSGTSYALFAYDSNGNYLNWSNWITSPYVDLRSDYKYGIVFRYDDSRTVSEAEIREFSNMFVFEPFEEKSSLIPLASPLRGINDVRDRIYERTYKNMKSVDLGTLNWTYYATWGSTKNSFYAGLQIDGISENDKVPNAVCTMFPMTSRNSANTNATDSLICFADSGKSITITNTNFTDANAFKTALNGVILHYESTEGGEDYTTFVCERETTAIDSINLRWLLVDNYGTYRFWRAEIADKKQIANVGLSENYTEIKYTTLANFGNNSQKNVIGFQGNTGVCVRTESDDIKPSGLLLYALATPTITELSAEAIEVIRGMRTYYPTTHFTFESDNGLIPDVNFEYMQNLKAWLGINN